MGLKSWNWWTPVTGTLYGWRCYHPGDVLLMLQGAQITPRLVYAYGGKTTQVPWTKRIQDEAWGSHRYGSPAFPWVDTVPGWTPHGTVTDLINAGGVFVIWQGRTVPLLLSAGEMLIAIRMRRPLYNYHGNLRNRRRVPIYAQEDQRQERDLLRGAQSGVPARSRPAAVARQSVSWAHAAVMTHPTVGLRVGNLRRWASYYQWVITAALLVVLGVLLLLGMTGSVGVAWVWDQRATVLGWGVLVCVGMALLSSLRLQATRRRRRRRRR